MQEVWYNYSKEAYLTYPIPIDPRSNGRYNEIVPIEMSSG